ncbi:MAG TPA: class I SAM-dependent methyltransferase [Gemmataceae bacterium]|nr:class I SAM-dependent methyltransferase [Gemmataceae bacterium]
MLDPLLAPLDDNRTLIDWIANLTGAPPEQVRQRLHREERDIGHNVREDLRRRRLHRHVWSDGLLEFYRETDAFLYELVAWNRHPDKLKLRNWVAEFLAFQGGRRRILCLGDGLGFDSLYLHRVGHEVTYSELSDLSSRFARTLFAHAGASPALYHETADKLPPESFDVVACLDVLEHVPDPPSLLADLARAIRPGGFLIVSAPFWMLTRECPTHLRSNRKYSGRLISLARANGLSLYDGRWIWEPLVLVKAGPGFEAKANRWRRFRLHLTGTLLATGNITVAPIEWLTTSYRWVRRSRWATELANGHSAAPIQK